MCEEELTIDGLWSLTVAFAAAEGVRAFCNAVKPEIVAPSESLIKERPFPMPSSKVMVAVNGGPTETALTASMKNSLSGSAFEYPSIFKI